jgi:DNA mismatch repair ATPase MutS
VHALAGLVEVVQRLREHCARARPLFGSTAFLGFCDTVAHELDDSYMTGLKERLRELQFPGGVLMSARVGRGGRVEGQVLRRSLSRNRRFLSRVALKRPIRSFTLPERDEAGADLLAELRDRSLNDVANAAAQAVDHVQAFFAALRTELAFYLAQLNLHAALTDLGVPVGVASVRDDLSALDLSDPCLALRVGAAPVGNEVALHGESLLVITGANHGGKSTFLRALGVAQLMLQAGMFAPARQLAAPLSGMLFTHWAREEDAELEHGKLDDELARMSTIVDGIRPGDLLLCNESFSSTNEAEGSELALDVTRALVAAGVRVRFVTHLYDFAHRLQESGEPPAVFLRAPRDDGGDRSYRLERGDPLPTSFGVDLFDRRFGTHHAAT